ncbi:hypothetical protein Tco_0128607 [Tanacetum coccineum]
MSTSVQYILNRSSKCTTISWQAGLKYRTTNAWTSRYLQWRSRFYGTLTRNQMVWDEEKDILSGQRASTCTVQAVEHRRQKRSPKQVYTSIESVSEEDSDPDKLRGMKDMQRIWHSLQEGFGPLCKECRKPKVLKTLRITRKDDDCAIKLIKELGSTLRFMAQRFQEVYQENPVQSCVNHWN